MTTDWQALRRTVWGMDQWTTTKTLLEIVDLAQDFAQTSDTEPWAQEMVEVISGRSTAATVIYRHSDGS